LNAKNFIVSASASDVLKIFRPAGFVKRKLSSTKKRT
jgi:hypothetical protein